MIHALLLCLCLPKTSYILWGTIRITWKKVETQAENTILLLPICMSPSVVADVLCIRRRRHHHHHCCSSLQRFLCSFSSSNAFSIQLTLSTFLQEQVKVIAVRLIWWWGKVASGDPGFLLFLVFPLRIKCTYDNVTVGWSA